MTYLALMRVRSGLEGVDAGAFMMATYMSTCMTEDVASRVKPAMENSMRSLR